ncbi:MAG: hypothetical protein V4598_00705 [Bdellovibrionota bacterium]
MSEALATPNSAPLFFLVFKHDVIIVENSIVIARPGGNVIARYDEKSNSMLCYIDKRKSDEQKISSFQRVTINGIDLKEDATVTLKVGDKLVIGPDTYTFFDNHDEAEKLVPARNRRKYKRPRSAYALSNLVNFYCSPPLALVLFGLIFAYAVFRHLPAFNLNAPAHLQFLSFKYSNDYVLSFLLTAVVTWFCCLVYSFLMYYYFNRNSVRIGAATIVFAIIAIGAVHWVSLPLNHIRNYVETREIAWYHEPNLNDKAISHILRLEKFKKGIARSYKHLKIYGTLEEQEILKKDHDETIRRIENENIQELEAMKND